jgi:hypothetical protein
MLGRIIAAFAGLAIILAILATRGLPVLILLKGLPLAILFMFAILIIIAAFSKDKPN